MFSRCSLTLAQRTRRARKRGPGREDAQARFCIGTARALRSPGGASASARKHAPESTSAGRPPASAHRSRQQPRRSDFRFRAEPTRSGSVAVGAGTDVTPDVS